MTTKWMGCYNVGKQKHDIGIHSSTRRRTHAQTCTYSYAIMCLHTLIHRNTFNRVFLNHKFTFCIYTHMHKLFQHIMHTIYTHIAQLKEQRAQNKRWLQLVFCFIWALNRENEILRHWNKKQKSEREREIETKELKLHISTRAYYLSSGMYLSHHTHTENRKL